jgi:hypothetical protein
MWLTFKERIIVPTNVERLKKVLPEKTVEALVEAAEKVQDKFDADPSLKDLYPGYSSLLNEIAKNVKTPEADEKKFEIVLDKRSNP